jgi:hypothetical protein
MTPNRRWRSGILLVLLAGLLGAGLAVPAAAALPPTIPPPVTSGTVGSHHLVDTAGSPGVTCHYPQDFNYVDRIRVRAPVARAAANKSSQRIGFRYVLQGYDGSGWHNIVDSLFQKRSATPTTKADFTDRSIAIDSFADTWGAYRIRVDLRWYSSSGAILGKASTWVTNYLLRWDGSTDAVVQGWCGDTTG